MREGRRSNQERTDQTRAALLDAARVLFVEHGFAATSTPAIVAAARVTRGALYHHFSDKQALFAALIEREAAAVADDIESAAPMSLGAREALLTGALAFLHAMTVPGRAKLLLIEGPAVLGADAMAAIDAAHGGRALRDGLAAVLTDPPGKVTIPALAALLSAAFDRAAMAVASGGSLTAYRASMIHLLERMLGPEPR